VPRWIATVSKRNAFLPVRQIYAAILMKPLSRAGDGAAIVRKNVPAAGSNGKFSQDFRPCGKNPGAGK
jgi:hypothetical protein